MKEIKPLVNKKLLLEKFRGKGGWTYARIPQVLQDKHAPFGWVKVKGTIDGYAISKYHLMPMGNGTLFLPVKAEIRKLLKKTAGDWVHVTLYADNEPLETPPDMLLCLSDEPNALVYYNALSDGEKKYYINWIYSAKKEATQTDRLAKTINRLARKLKYHDKTNLKQHGIQSTTGQPNQATPD